MSAALWLALAAASGVVLVALRVRAWAPMPTRLPMVVATAQPRRTWSSFVRRRPRPPGEREVAAWCERVAAGLRAGRSLTSSVVDADNASPDGGRPFPDVVHAVHRGRSIGDAFRAVTADPSTPTGLAAPVLAACAELGGPSAQPIDGVADVLMARADERAERLAASAQARLSARVMTTVPVAVAALLVIAEPAVRHAVATPAGLACVAAGAALNGAGWCWTHAMIRSAS